MTVVLLLAEATSRPLALHAETTAASGATAITTLPYVISSPGVYFLQPPAGSSSFAAPSMPNGYAIAITASNVVLDLNGYTLTNSGAPSNGAYGIYSTGAVHNVTVRNGSIVGFYRGVILYTSAWDYTTCYNDLIENLHVSVTGYSGIELYGGGHTVRHCRIDNNSTSGGTYGIGIQGPGARVIDNDFTDVQPSGGNTYGIFFNSGADCFAVNNRLSRVVYGIFYGGGATGKYRDNIAGVSVTTPYSGGTNAGNNE